MKTTPWFPGDVDPVRIGVYQRRHDSTGAINFSYWNGVIWCATAVSWEAAHKNGIKCIGSWHQYIEWRGLTEPTEKK